MYRAKNLLNIPFLDTLGPLPTKYQFASFDRSAEYEALCEQVRLAYDDQSERAIVKQLIRQVGEDATVIPLFVNPSTPMMQPYVHTYKYEETGVMPYWFYGWWMEQQ